MCIDIQLEVFEESKGILEGLEDGDVCCYFVSLFVRSFAGVGGELR